jgi:hypothetical protein
MSEGIPFEWFALGFGIGFGAMSLAVAMLIVAELIRKFRPAKNQSAGEKQ